MGFFDWFNPHNDFAAKPIVNSFSAQQMGGVNAADPALGNAQQNYGQQQDYINALRAQSQGQGPPSVAQNLLQQQTEANSRGAASAIASQRGMNPGLQAKLLLDQQATQQQQAAGQGSLLRAQEIQNAQGMLGGALGQQAGSNLGAGNLALGQQGQQLGNYWNAQSLNAGVAGQNANLAQQAQSLNADVAHQNAQTGGSLLGGLVGGLSGGLIKMGLPTPGGVQPAHGGVIPGQANVPGDSHANDTVPADLSPGEIVLPRSIAQAEDAPEKAAAFVRAVRRKHMAGGGEVPNYGKVLEMQRGHEGRIKAIEERMRKVAR